MRLTRLLEKVTYTILQGPQEREVSAIENDSRKVTEGALFFCIRGAVTDGHKYIPEVLQKGAGVLIVEEEVKAPAEVTVVLVPDSRMAMALIAAAWYGYPAGELKVIGVTGTKGKTTTTYMIRSILEKAGYKVGLIGTIEAIIGEEVIPAAHTTPESITIQHYFRKMLDCGCQICVMEVSSQGLMLHRTAGIPFELGIFTNISPDHIGPAEHESFEDYLECKSRLFRQCRVGIFNADDPHLEQILEGHTCKVETFGFSGQASIRAADTQLISRPGYLGVACRITGEMNFEVEIDIPGRFSVYNSLTAIAVCRHFKVSPENIRAALKGTQVRGRIEMVPVSDEFTLMIDYAHNAMALESLLTTLREYRPKRLICLFGCGGNRSRLRRFEMGEVSGKLSDLTVITSDNPRFEDPERIMDDIETGIKKTDGSYIRIADRREAIAWVIHNGKRGDVIVLAGKGHEDYQEIEGRKYPMDERVIIRDILEADAREAALRKGDK